MVDDLIELQTKLAFQEDAIDALNAVVAAHESRISALERSQLALTEQLRTLAASISLERGQEPPPPHY